MIASFKDAATQGLFETGKSRRFPAQIHRIAQRKLKYLAAANDVRDLRQPPGNRLESLKGDREGQFSIRINDQYRVCFIWRDGNAHEVEIVDYHRAELEVIRGKTEEELCACERSTSRRDPA